MELIHFWVRDYHPFDICSFDLSGRFQVDIDLSEENHTITIDIKEDVKFPLQFFGEKIQNISAIIGANGAGKTRIIELLSDILSSDGWSSYPDYLLIYFNKMNKEFHLEHNFYDSFGKGQSGETLKEDSRFDIKSNVSKGFSFSVDKRHSGYTPKVVYYAPYLDLKKYSIEKDRENLFDVSTDYLIFKDSESKNTENELLTTHRFKNIDRQFNFINRFKGSADLFGKFPIPQEVVLHSLESRDNKNWSRNLSLSARQIREYFLGDKSSRGGVIKDEINIAADELRFLRKKIKRDSQEYLDVKPKKAKLFFLFDFIVHFFSALNSDNLWNEIDIGVKVEEINQLDVWEAFKYFLKHQQWTDDKEESAIKLLDLLLKIPISKFSEPIKWDSDRSITTKEQTALLDILIAQDNYLRSLPTWKGLGTTPDLIRIDWRNLSSGEKAFLDIFSRLSYAYELIKNNLQPKHKNISPPITIESVYLFLDEGEIGFHPDWQREYINLLVDVVPEIFKGMSIQIIVTSHSPFVISDLPSQNVVFLSKENEGASIARKRTKLKNTFASNIHSLLADGFFMSKGLVGKFAKKKINAIIEWINGTEEYHVAPDNSIAKEIKNMIDLIGEPIIKNKLLEMYNDKLGIDGELEQIENEIRALKEKKEIIQNKKNA